ncbi:dihydropteroate synthase [Fodinibius sp. SL11]|uniref:dihydropteroate synthase n=1 Tax=Fodinibius sp. SL11 TaxID=3425690 RepID=UPI003F885BFF
MNENSPKNQILSIRDKKLDLSTPKIMGILNTTPDSFSDGGEYNEVESAVGRIGGMVSEGAHIVDIGGESTRPGADPVSEQEELERVLPVLEKAIPQFPDTFFSIDTTKYHVAEEALKLGTHFVNDISGLQKEPRFVRLCKQYNAGYVMMHSQGDPKNMQEDPAYDDVISDIKQFLKTRIDQARKKGFENIIIDPGIGFGKTLNHNLKLIAHLDEFQDLGCPILVGASRKSMVGQILGNRPVDDRLTGTLAVHYHAMINGANIIRVHDVKEAHDSLQVFNAISSVR